MKHFPRYTAGMNNKIKKMYAKGYPNKYILNKITPPDEPWKYGLSGFAKITRGLEDQPTVRHTYMSAWIDDHSKVLAFIKKAAADKKTLYEIYKQADEKFDFHKEGFTVGSFKEALNRLEIPFDTRFKKRVK